MNLGPLLYHWANDVEHNEDARYQQSIELSWEELRHVIGTYGFQFNKEVNPLVATHHIYPPTYTYSPRHQPGDPLCRYPLYIYLLIIQSLPPILTRHGINQEFVECKYANNEESIMWTAYKAIFFSVTKPML